MKLKTIFLAGMVSAAGALAVSAADVFSVNAVGFVNITIPAGQFKIIGNPLNQGDNTLATILPNAPVNTRIYRYNSATTDFTLYTKRSTFWSNGGDAAVFKPGEGFFVQNVAATDITLTFVGEVAQGATLTINVPTGFSMIAAHVPQSANLESELGLAAKTNDKVYFFRAGDYSLATRRSSGSWTGPGIDPVSLQPKPEVGEGFFFLNANTPITWVRNFSANN